MPRPLRKYRLHKASGRAVVQCKALFGNKRRYLAGKFESPEMFADWADVLAQYAALLGAEPKKTPTRQPSRIGDLAAAYLAFLKDRINKHTRFNIKRAVSHFDNDPLGRLPVDKFGPSSLEQIRKKMEASGWARQHINSQIGRLKTMFKWGVSREIVKEETYARLLLLEPLREGHTTAPERPKIGPVDWPSVKIVLPFLTPTVADIVRVHYLSGMRSDEITALRMDEIDFTGDVWIYKKKKHKTAHLGKAKIVCFGPQAQMILRKYTGKDVDYLFTPAQAVAEQAEARARGRKSKIYGRQRERIVKFRRTAERYNARSYQHALRYGFLKLAKSLGHEGEPAKGESLKAWLKARDIVYWHPHMLRHSRSTATQDRYGIEGVRAQTGNSLQAAQIYAGPSLALAKRIARESG